MILADTSIWIDHFRRSDARLVASLEWGSVAVHPHVIGELACGRLKNRDAILDLMMNLPRAPVATEAEAQAFLDARQLMGRGIGWIDVHLLASTALADGMRLWTRDRRLAEVAQSLDLALD